MPQLIRLEATMPRFSPGAVFIMVQVQAQVHKGGELDSPGAVSIMVQVHARVHKGGGVGSAIAIPHSGALRPIRKSSAGTT